MNLYLVLMQFFSVTSLFHLSRRFSQNMVFLPIFCLLFVCSLCVPLANRSNKTGLSRMKSPIGSKYDFGIDFRSPNPTNFTFHAIAKKLFGTIQTLYHCCPGFIKQFSYLFASHGTSYASNPSLFRSLMPTISKRSTCQCRGV